jgi:hypothetical protein
LAERKQFGDDGFRGWFPHCDFLLPEWVTFCQYCTPSSIVPLIFGRFSPSMIIFRHADIWLSEV